MRGRRRVPDGERSEDKVLVAIRAGSQTYEDMEKFTGLSASTVRSAAKKLLDMGEVVRNYTVKRVGDRTEGWRHNHPEPLFSPKEAL